MIGSEKTLCAPVTVRGERPFRGRYMSRDATQRRGAGLRGITHGTPGVSTAYYAILWKYVAIWKKKTLKCHGPTARARADPGSDRSVGRRDAHRHPGAGPPRVVRPADEQRREARRIRRRAVRRDERRRLDPKSHLCYLACAETGHGRMRQCAERSRKPAAVGPSRLSV